MANSKRIPRDPEEKARSRIGIFSIIMVLLVTLLMLLEAMAGTPPVQSNNPAVTANIEPIPTMNTNITWSTFYNGWNPLEYSNGTNNKTLAADTNGAYANPISVNASSIKTTVLTRKIGAIYWNNSANWNIGNTASGGGQINTVSETTANGEPAILIQVNATGAYGDQTWALLPIEWNALPSQNLAYDFLTITGYAYGTSTLLNDRLYLENQTKATGTDLYALSIDAANETTTTTTNMYSITTGQSFFASLSLNQPNVSMLKSSGVSIGITANTPKETSTPINIVITGISVTEYPLSLGQTSLGGSHTATGYIGKAALSSFAPSFQWNYTTDNGYTVAVSQPLQNLTTQQSAVSSGSYVEQVEYQGSFVLPTAPDLSYGSANLTEQFNVSTAQTQVLDINGVSYLATISGKNGTVQLLTSVNPNSQTQFLQIVDYTQSQWTSISSPPGIFTIQGIEYYWEEFIIAILAVVGIGAGAASKHASSLRKVK